MGPSPVGVPFVGTEAGPVVLAAGVGVASSSPVSGASFSDSSFSMALTAAREPLLTAALMLFKSCGR